MVFEISFFDIDLKFVLRKAARASLDTLALNRAAEEVKAAVLRKDLLFNFSGEKKVFLILILYSLAIWVVDLVSYSCILASGDHDSGHTGGIAFGHSSSRSSGRESLLSSPSA